MADLHPITTTSLHALGGIVAVLYLGYLIDRVGPERSLALHYAVGAVFVAAHRLHAATPFLHPTHACAGRRDGQEPQQN